MERNLIAAIKENDLAKAEKALENGANPNSEMMPLLLAIKFQREKIVNALLEHGANPNQRVGHDSTLLLTSLEYWRTGMTLQLLAYRADPNWLALDGTRPLDRAFEKSRTDAIVKMIEVGADVHVPDSGGSTPLHHAIKGGNTGIAIKILDLGADINARDGDGMTALHHAALRGRADQVIMLLERGADETLGDHEFKTPAKHAEKKFPGLAAILRGQRPGALMPQRENGAWTLVADDEVARVTVKGAISYRVTEIFNFNSRVYTQISRNLETGAESSAIKAFSSVGEGGLIAAAQSALEQLGGHVPQAAKKKLPGATAGMGA